ncbi:hypothetical protein M422DRAFT_30918 [Sphaerobolus stellatus SS14]|uniref:Tyr recombinase domain-containing protein n=1 Tax=Sphaerobolus stellatus (strain SS14) TaxID=990650 RepID=A0A0C9V927_SPHS4|nr:hypothetical protein M422DRAFT_30918 [Sphaerobolus stellatus SS14]
MIRQICSVLDPNNKLHVAAYACLTVTFWTMARTVEFVVSDLQSFTASRNITRSMIREDVDRSGNWVLIFTLPWTKVKPEGEDVYCSRHDGPADPIAALINHLRINNPPPDAALFSWQHHNGMRVLTRSAFTQCISDAATRAGLPKLHFHGLRIGSVLEYLLRGTPFEAVKTMGRWSSDSFTLYLRKHAVVLAPYIQNSPISSQFHKIILPPVR